MHTQHVCVPLYCNKAGLCGILHRGRMYLQLRQQDMQPLVNSFSELSCCTCAG